MSNSPIVINNKNKNKNILHTSTLPTNNLTINKVSTGTVPTSKVDNSKLATSAVPTNNLVISKESTSTVAASTVAANTVATSTVPKNTVANNIVINNKKNDIYIKLQKLCIIIQTKLSNYVINDINKIINTKEFNILFNIFKKIYETRNTPSFIYVNNPKNNYILKFIKYLDENEIEFIKKILNTKDYIKLFTTIYDLFKEKDTKDLYMSFSSMKIDYRITFLSPFILKDKYIKIPFDNNSNIKKKYFINKLLNLEQPKTPFITRDNLYKLIKDSNKNIYNELERLCIVIQDKLFDFYITNTDIEKLNIFFNICKKIYETRDVKYFKIHLEGFVSNYVLKFVGILDEIEFKFIHDLLTNENDKTSFSNIYDFFIHIRSDEIYNALSSMKINENITFLSPNIKQYKYIKIPNSNDIKKRYFFIYILLTFNISAIIFEQNEINFLKKVLSNKSWDNFVDEYEDLYKNYDNEIMLSYCLGNLCNYDFNNFKDTIANQIVEETNKTITSNKVKSSKDIYDLFEIYYCITYEIQKLNQFKKIKPLIRIVYKKLSLKPELSVKPNSEKTSTISNPELSGNLNPKKTSTISNSELSRKPNSAKTLTISNPELSGNHNRENTSTISNPELSTKPNSEKTSTISNPELSKTLKPELEIKGTKILNIRSIYNNVLYLCDNVLKMLQNNNKINYNYLSSLDQDIFKLNKECLEHIEIFNESTTTTKYTSDQIQEQIIELNKKIDEINNLLNEKQIKNKNNNNIIIIAQIKLKESCNNSNSLNKSQKNPNNEKSISQIEPNNTNPHILTESISTNPELLGKTSTTLNSESSVKSNPEIFSNKNIVEKNKTSIISQKRKIKTNPLVISSKSP
jgi:hypothetical protein